MSEIPKARGLVQSIISHHRTMTKREIARVLRRIVPLLWREKYIRRVPVTADKITPAKRRQIRRVYYANPKMPMRKIGLLCGVDGGRVSEVMNGKKQNKRT